MKRRYCVALCCLLVMPGVALAGADESIAPWLIDTEDRFELRMTWLRAHVVNGSATSDATILGAENPELFFPWELMDRLLGQAVDDHDAAAAFRATYEQGVGDLGLTKSEWNELGTDIWALLRTKGGDRFAESMAQGRALGVRKRELERGSAGANRIEQARIHQHEARRIQGSLREARNDVLASMYEIFEKENFDRFLYRTVAPGLFITYVDVVDLERVADQLRSEGGLR